MNLDDENTPLYTVGQVAQLLAVKQAFLRRCDELRVVSPRRSAGGQRRYSRLEIRVIQQVVSMADEGMTLPAIRRIIELEHELAEVTAERDELARRLAELRFLGGKDQAGLAGFAGRGLGQLLEHRKGRRQGGTLRRGEVAQALRQHQGALAPDPLQCLVSARRDGERGRARIAGVSAAPYVAAFFERRHQTGERGRCDALGGG
jgi:MerR family transcriptional regulator/heat shock protein HspR